MWLSVSILSLSNVSLSSLPLWGRAVGLLPGSAPPWGHLGGNGHSVAPSTTSMRQRGRRWIEPDHRWSPAGTTGSPKHLEMERREREGLSEQWTQLYQRKRWHRQTWLPREDRLCLFRMLNEKEKPQFLTVGKSWKKKKLITPMDYPDISTIRDSNTLPWWWWGAKMQHSRTKIQNTLHNQKNTHYRLRLNWLIMNSGSLAESCVHLNLCFLFQ